MGFSKKMTSCREFHSINIVIRLQVSEVLTESKIRLSISGWFHSLTDPNYKHLKYVEEQKRTNPIDIEVNFIFFTFSFIYKALIRQNKQF